MYVALDLTATWLVVKFVSLRGSLPKLRELIAMSPGARGQFARCSWLRLPEPQLPTHDLLREAALLPPLPRGEVLVRGNSALVAVLVFSSHEYGGPVRGEVSVRGAVQFSALLNGEQGGFKEGRWPLSPTSRSPKSC